MTQHKFRSDTIDGEVLDRLAAAEGCESRAELLRTLVRRAARENEIPINPDP